MDKKEIMRKMRDSRKEARQDIKKEVAKTIDAPTQRERMVAANASSMVPTLKLNDNEKALYDAIATHLEKTGMLATVDTVPLTMLAQSMLLYGQAKSLINDVEDAMAPVGTNGAMTPSGAYLVMKTERKAVMDLFKDLGLDGKTRLKLWADMTRIADGNDNDEVDPLLQ